MWEIKRLRRLHIQMILIMLALMGISLLVVSSTTLEDDGSFFSPYAISQLEWFLVSWLVFFFFSALDYQILRTWSYVFYLGILFLLVGLYFAPAIQNVHRWYRIPVLGMGLQPSEYAKLALILAMSRFLENRALEVKRLGASLQAFLIFMIPFALIIKQPDLGTALILFPISLMLFYLGGMHRKLLKTLLYAGLAALLFILSIFMGIFSHEEMRPYVTKVLHEYQYERLNPSTYHQRASQIAISLGGTSGSGFGKSEFTGRKWLPAAHTDSVFAAYAEEYGLVGVLVLLLFFFGLIYCGFQIAKLAKDRFGRLLAVGIAGYLAMHAIVNMGMMCGFLPITGVPLLMISYGGSSLLCTMAALGILQSIYSRSMYPKIVGNR